MPAGGAKPSERGPKNRGHATMAMRASMIEAPAVAAQRQPSCTSCCGRYTFALQVPSDVTRKLGRGGIAAPGIALQAFRAIASRSPGSSPSFMARRAAAVFGHKFVEKYAEGIDVRRLGERVALELLRAGVLGLIIRNMVAVTSRVTDPSSGSRILPMPKSSSLGCPDAVISMLPGLTSR